jgi:hypothetical protein
MQSKQDLYGELYICNRCFTTDLSHTQLKQNLSTSVWKIQGIRMCACIQDGQNMKKKININKTK